MRRKVRSLELVLLKHLSVCKEVSIIIMRGRAEDLYICLPTGSVDQPQLSSPSQVEALCLRQFTNQRTLLTLLKASTDIPRQLHRAGYDFIVACDRKLRNPYSNRLYDIPSVEE